MSLLGQDAAKAWASVIRENPIMGDVTLGLPQRQRELISFRISGQDFSTDVRQVREIRGWTAVTAMPHAPQFVVGVINLRGTVMPVVDIGARLGFAASVPTEHHVIIVVNIQGQWTGLMVEDVSETSTVPADQIHPAPNVASRQTRDFVEGYIIRGDSMVTVISLDHVIPEISPEALEALAL
jgi:purine-binding chemotaxis protein CheW